MELHIAWDYAILQADCRSVKVNTVSKLKTDVFHKIKQVESML